MKSEQEIKEKLNNIQKQIKDNNPISASEFSFVSGLIMGLEWVLGKEKENE